MHRITPPPPRVYHEKAKPTSPPSLLTPPPAALPPPPSAANSPALIPYPARPPPLGSRSPSSRSATAGGSAEHYNSQGATRGPGLSAPPPPLPHPSSFILCLCVSPPAAADSEGEEYPCCDMPLKTPATGAGEISTPGEQEKSQQTEGGLKLSPSSKRGKKEDPNDYRPVRLTSIPGKILE
ncbi:proline-rich receptor-like protein kinase PERK8 [Sphaerodactylus townsendi]|uniref:proline-rich receptor-like protein kinase PERK8 n=1 Tax=Sphaerodactylus townsendi TaxID=933632 RepID=UPI002025D1CC|nr:proline-rich receptor-like protein kinase PERK8 [Sphaerodactylus townsendi]